MTALALLLLTSGALAFWLLVESKLSWIFKIISISLFCVGTIVFYLSLSSFLGWAAMDKDLPEKVSIHWVVVKEPSKIVVDKGRIYLLVESFRTKYESKLLNMFGYKARKDEPRLFSIPYSRQLHESLEKDVIPRLKDGQTVDGKFTKGDGSGSGKGGKGKGNGKGGKGKGEGDGKGGGSESQEQEYHFYNLTPGEIQKK
jgi:uncharacterized membrane protein YgcG